MYLYKAYLVRVVNGGLIKATIDLGYGVMLSSMPIHLVRVDHNTFNVSQIAWEDRLVGDTTTVPDVDLPYPLLRTATRCP